MNPEVKALWIADLRSGKHEQVKGRLREGDSFCCLGRLCDISGLGEWKENTYKTAAHYDAGVLPVVVMAWADLNSTSGYFRSMVAQDAQDLGPQCESLAVLNDAGFTFSQIADIIEYFF